MHAQYDRVLSPIGNIHLLAGDEGLFAAFFDSQIADMEQRFPSEIRRSGHDDKWLLRAEAFLACYFAGDFAFSDEVPLAPRGTPFQERVWGLLGAIPPGQTRTYGALADLLGSPSSCRAVGAAVGRNPLSIFTPCHRVVGASGKLTGYAGGIDRKRFLLEHEQTAAPKPNRSLSANGQA